MSNLEDRRAEGGCQVLLHMSGERGAAAHDEAHAATKGRFEGAEDVLVQQRCCLHSNSMSACQGMPETILLKAREAHQAGVDNTSSRTIAEP